MFAKLPYAIRTIILAASIWVTAFWYCKTNFYRDPGSAFFDENRAFGRVYSAHRETQAVDFFAGASQSSPKAAQSPSLCVAFQTVKRTGEQPLNLAIASALEGLSPQERADVYVGVMFANTDPEEHPSWHNRQLRYLVDEAYSYNVTKENHAMLQDWEVSHHFGKKGIFDYTYSLEHCLTATEAPWIAMIEDDVIFAEGWLSYTLNNLANLDKRLGSTTSDAQDWLYLRLFNQERSTGWASKSIGGNNEHIITIAIAIPLIALVCILRRCYPRTHRILSNWTLAAVCCIILPAFIVLFFQAGKASMLPPRPGVRAEAFGCCSQGLVFSREKALFLLDRLREQESGQVDLILNGIAWQEGLLRYAQYPVMMQHIGRNSVRGTIAQDAQAVWSMAFENLSPSKLAKQHGAMVRQRYGGD